MLACQDKWKKEREELSGGEGLPLAILMFFFPFFAR